MQRIVLAYSGDSAASTAMARLIERERAEIVAVTLDLGQGGDLTDVRERALAAGAVRVHVIDAREEFVRDYILPALQAGTFHAADSPLAAPLGRALVAKRLVDVARMEGASTVACGGGLEPAIRALDPSLDVIALGGLPETPQNDAAPREPYKVDVNLWGRAIDCGSIGIDEDGIYTLTRAPGDCPDEPAHLEIEFEAGVPVGANGIEMSMLELIESLEIIAGAHGVGRIGPVGDGANGQRLDAHEAPAAAVLHAAHAGLERHVIPPDLAALKHTLAREYVRLIAGGHWFSPTRDAIDAFVRTIQPRVTGIVRLELLKGQCRVAGHRLRASPDAGGEDQGESHGRLDRAAAEGLIS